MNSFYIKSSRAIVKITADNNEIKKIFKDDFLYAYIPSVEIIFDHHYRKINAIINISKTNKNKIDFRFPVIDFYYKTFNSKDIISLIEYVLERARQEMGIICIHGSGAIVNNKAVICWGPATGMGKTSLAIGFSQNGNEFYSDEKILIDLKKSMVVGRIKYQYLSNDFWKREHGYEKYYQPKNLSKDDNFLIRLFIYGIVSESEYILDVWDSTKFFWHIYEESCRKIRGTSRLFFNSRYSPPSLDTEELAKKRIIWLVKFTKTIPSVYYRGNIESAKMALRTFFDGWYI